MDTRIRKILLGVCALSRKTMGKPMKSIIEVMIKEYGDYFDIIHFSDNIILNEDIQKWPIVDALISFHSTGFPIHKAISYIKLRKPFLINDLEKQLDIMDRVKVLTILKNVGINHPRYGIVNRNDKGELLNNFEEKSDYIVIDGKMFVKPFVEKPFSGEDHNITIYYHSSQGGGSRNLFRKVNDVSSAFSETSTVRKDKGYIYEEFIETSELDIKCYAVGDNYCYAESRKAPSGDGVVVRDETGKEKRQEVVLRKNELEYASKIVEVFNHTVCGFDILRDKDGSSYVCDVNGFSFVKGVPKYYENAGKIIGEKVVKHFF
uniref:ATP-grasp domain-containing protein n=1 Tax=Parastrongyloides trichosuri TaxID=131310 RepID=A0A0N4ZBW0_PARTI